MDDDCVLNQKTSGNSSVSIVICTKNEEINIKNALDSLTENDLINPEVEIVIVDGCSTDKTAQIVSEYPVKVLYEATGTRGGASNIGWKNATGEIVVYTNADCLFRRGWISSIVKSFNDPKIAAVGGMDLTPLHATSYFEKASGLLDELRTFPKHRLGAVFRLRGCNVAYRQSALVKCGGFDEGLNDGEEVELQYRLHKMGYDLVFDPSVIVYHKRRSSLVDYWRQFIGCGFGKSQLVEKHPSSLFAPEVFMFPFMFSLFLVSIIAYLLSSIIFLPLFLGVLLIPTVYMTYMMIKASLYARSFRFLPGILLALFLRNVAIMVGFFEGALYSGWRRIRRTQN